MLPIESQQKLKKLFLPIVSRLAITIKKVYIITVIKTFQNYKKHNKAVVQTITSATL